MAHGALREDVMGLKLKWTDFEDGSGAFANAGGFAILVGKDGRWSVIAVGNVDVSSHAPTLEAAQEAAEAAASRLLAEDAGVRALLGLRWIPVTERLPNQWDVVQVWALDLHVSSAWLDDQPEWVDRAGLLPARPTHWRPLPDGPGASA